MSEQQQSQQSNDDGQQGNPDDATQQQDQQGQSTTGGTSQPEGTESSEQQGQQGLDGASNDELIAEIKRLRNENARDRTQARDNAAQEAETSIVNRLATALGLGGGDGEDNAPSADELQAQLTESQAQQRQRDVEFAAWRAASTHELDPQVLLNQVSFQNRIASLDPAADTFAADLEQAIKDEQTENGLFAQPDHPRRSSSPLNNKRGNDGKGNDSQSPAELAKAINKLTPY